MVSLSWFDKLTTRPWAAQLFGIQGRVSRARPRWLSARLAGRQAFCMLVAKGGILLEVLDQLWISLDWLHPFSADLREKRLVEGLTAASY